jgi:hypothetical protein
MSLMSWSLAGLLALEAAVPPQGGATKCEPTDNRCKAELFVRRAKEAKNDEQRALYFNVAHRSYLALFDRTGDERHLCAARRMYDKSVAIKNQPAGQRASFEALRGDLTSRERKEGGRCGSSPKRPQADAPLLTAKEQASAAPAANTSSVETTPANASSGDAPPAAANSADARPERAPGKVAVLEPMPASREPVDALLPVSRRPEPSSVNTSTTPRPGRDLVIGGGVTLGLGLVLVGVATYTGADLLATRREARLLQDMVDGHATDDQLAQDATLRHDYRRLGPPTLALALAGGASVVVGAVLLAVGGRRMARAPSQTALIPVPGGVAFRARF